MYVSYTWCRSNQVSNQHQHTDHCHILWKLVASEYACSVAPNEKLDRLFNAVTTPDPESKTGSSLKRICSLLRY